MKKILSLFLSFAVMITSFSVFGFSASAVEYAKEMPEIKEHGFITAEDGAKIEYGIWYVYRGSFFLTKRCKYLPK